jgi:hypothetical protein
MAHRLVLAALRSLLPDNHSGSYKWLGLRFWVERSHLTCGDTTELATLID